MNFFAHQQRARQNTKFLIFLFLLAVIGTVVGVNIIVALAIGTKASLAREFTSTFIFTTIATLFVIVAGSVYRLLALRQGGSAIATLMGGVQLTKATHDTNEKRLLNVVEEMAIASGVRVPKVYLIPEEGINAFAAGLTPSDAVIGVTQGCLETMNRDELQGIIAHEFSHIFNGDMRMNLHLVGVLHGILMLGTLGQYLMRFTERRGSRRNSSSGQAQQAMFFIGLGIFLVGMIGLFFGRLIKASLSRQREFLADASAVQFTRNPQGIGNALVKIKNHVVGSQIMGKNAEDMSHLFFGSAMSFSSWFATHPPLDSRISAIFGSLMEAKPSSLPPKVPHSPSQELNSPSGVSTLAENVRIEGLHDIVSSIGQPTAQSSEVAHHLLTTISESLRNTLEDPDAAMAAIILLLSLEGSFAIEKYPEVSNKMLQLFHRLSDQVKKLPRAAHIPVLDLCLSSLQTLPHESRESFSRLTQKLVWHDQKQTLRELTLQMIIAKQLQTHRHRLLESRGNLQSFAAEISVILSALAQVGANDTSAVKNAYERGWQALHLNSPASLFTQDYLNPEKISLALERLRHMPPLEKEKFISAISECISADDTLNIKEYEMLNLICATLNCPLPPVAFTTPQEL